MGTVAYYPGCTLKDRSLQLDQSARATAEKLGAELVEVQPWTCCGAVPPSSQERVMNLVAPVRILKRTRDAGEAVLVTICDFCYNVLKRANYRMRTDTVLRTRVNAYLKEDEPLRDYELPPPASSDEYRGEVRVLHYFEYLRDEIGYATLAERVERPLQGLRIAPYYGCVMLRPKKEIELDDPENPRIMEDFLLALSAEPVAYPYRNECCGSFLSVSSSDSSARLCHEILASAQKHGAEALMVSCPLCHYNLEARQETIAKAFPGFEKIPVFYFTQLLGVALGVAPSALGFERHRVDCRPVLAQKDFVA